MRATWQILIGMVLLAGAVVLASRTAPARAAGEPGEELVSSRRQIDKLHADPEQYAKWKREWKEFMKLPREKRLLLRQIDEELTDEDPHLWIVLDRYNSWLEHLPEADRRQIETAADSKQKLQIIHELRDREWVAHQPRTVREEVQQATEPEARTALVLQLRRAERKLKDDWQTALRDQADVFPTPPGPTDIRGDIALFVSKSLNWRLPPEKRIQLDLSRMAGPNRYGETLVKLSGEFPITIPPADSPGVTRLSEKTPGPGKPLSQEWQQALHLPQMGAKGGFRERDRGGAPEKDLRKLQSLQGRWPDFALAVHEYVAKRGNVPGEPLGPCRQKEFLPRVQKLIDELEKDPEARKELHELSGHWPEYPYAVMKWAKEKNEDVPGTKLPGTDEFWKKVRAGGSEPPE